uniref:Replication protein A C-terminal domain-containing protein n=1 Tax=Pinguiococcus pyrenoidosus TaxID=172671 RepID=A0A7R9YC23_9STRA|mmetsp:Transcript_17670/g.67217  ORF Transcript_17670/g.67217 Transcript_17670/m.67217 type:complete len:306 (+) Transcript_17670:63-980(+)
MSGYGGSVGGFEYGGGDSYGGSNGMFGGGDFDGGGGFMADSNENGFGSPSGTTPKKSSIRERQTLMPLTLAQLSKATQDVAGDTWLINDNEIHLVTVVGCILDRREQSTSVSYDVEDGTGKITVKHWFDQDESPEALTRRQECTEGRYIRCVGKINEFGGQKNVIAFHVNLIGSLDELAHHFLECIYVRCKIQQAKKNPGMRQPSFGSPGQVNFANGASNGGQRALQSNAFEEAHEGLTHAQRLVIQAFEQDGGAEAGRQIDSVIAECTAQGLSAQECQAAVSHFAEEGLIYATIDDRHFKYTRG